MSSQSWDWRGELNRPRPHKIKQQQDTGFPKPTLSTALSAFEEIWVDAETDGMHTKMLTVHLQGMASQMALLPFF